ncbi:LnmK family bifunctional acyltransferase/decarboxylase [Catellatospora vulcania]|uniref:LnmK family bifunctional acyltransferase/decarboxylase n=1 Tax=Catellatospora vulcania TaxID=1460450 RepID=UPI0012D4ADA6|nr:LnmK family bifunctional acyltransferase/decarboxylase [Catellatospora vulcania]
MTTTLIHPQVWRSADGSVCRLVTIKPGMCGHNSLFYGQLGDWTWETVSELCEADAFNAYNAAGQPTYLSFYYFHVRAGDALHPRSLSFGHRVEVVSRVFGFGSESVLTLHRLRQVGPDYEADPDAGFEPYEFYDAPRADCLYVQNFNRWVSRGRDGSNEGLVAAAPVGFRHEHLPQLPAQYSPRLVYSRARQQLTFHDPQQPGWREVVGEHRTDYRIDISRDVNGVGLLYFASYFSIVDGALLGLWRELGRSDRSFLDRVVHDQKLCYLGNADVDTRLRITMRSWRAEHDPAEEMFNAVIEDSATDRVLAVCTLHIRSEGSHVERR